MRSVGQPVPEGARRVGGVSPGGLAAPFVIGAALALGLGGCGGGAASGCLTVCHGRFKFPGFGGGRVSLLVKFAGAAFGVFPFAATHAQL